MSAKYEWRCVPEKAAFAARDSAGTLVFRDRMWLLGGWPDFAGGDEVFYNDVWSSEDPPVFVAAPPVILTSTT